MTEYNLWQSLPTSPVELQDSGCYCFSYLIGMVLVLKKKKVAFASAKVAQPVEERQII